MHKLHTTVRRISPAHLIRSQRTRRVFMNFANMLDLVYFGSVSHNDEERRLLRGITESVTQVDSHYCVGTFKGYDIATVLRRDGIKYRDKRFTEHHWTILTVDLTTHNTVPDFYVLHETKRELMLAKFNQTPQIYLGTYTGALHSDIFLKEYAVYASPAHAHEIDLLLIPDLTHALALHFRDISVEILDNTIYIYRSGTHPTKPQLEQMLNAGIWLAQLIDEHYQNI